MKQEKTKNDDSPAKERDPYCESTDEEGGIEDGKDNYCIVSNEREVECFTQSCTKNEDLIDLSLNRVKRKRYSRPNKFK